MEGDARTAHDDCTNSDESVGQSEMSVVKEQVDEPVVGQMRSDWPVLAEDLLLPDRPARKNSPVVSADVRNENFKVDGILYRETERFRMGECTRQLVLSRMYREMTHRTAPSVPSWAS